MEKRTLKAGFWNTERATNPKMDRGKLVVEKVSQWVKQSEDKRPDIIFLAEVTQMGEALVEELKKACPGYKVEFWAVADVNKDVSPCSFLVLTREKIGATVAAHGASTRRPYINVTCLGGKAQIAAIHATADQGQKALNDIIDALTDLRDADALIGDMNFPEDKNLDAVMKGDVETIDAMGWKPVYPKVKSYKSKKSGTEKVLDYIWVGKKGQAIPLDAPSAAFSDIDHAPIFFEVGY